MDLECYRKQYSKNKDDFIIQDAANYLLAKELQSEFNKPADWLSRVGLVYYQNVLLVPIITKKLNKDDEFEKQIINCLEVKAKQDLEKMITH